MAILTMIKEESTEESSVKEMVLEKEAKLEEEEYLKNTEDKVTFKELESAGKTKIKKKIISEENKKRRS